MGSKLLSVSCYWQNDKPIGLGFTILNDNGELDKTLAIFKDQYSAMWAEAVTVRQQRELAVHLKAQLHRFAITKDTMSDADSYLALANVWLLVEMGELANDEFNGLVYGYQT